MRHDQDRPAVSPGNAGEDGHSVGTIERDRLVGEDRGRLGNDPPGNCDALLFAAAQIARKAYAFQDLARFDLGTAALLAADSSASRTFSSAVSVGNR